MKTICCLILIVPCLFTLSLRADEVIFNNGDKLTGKVLSADGGKLKVKSDIAGKITTDEGVLRDQAVAIVPVEILCL